MRAHRLYANALTIALLTTALSGCFAEADQDPGLLPAPNHTVTIYVIDVGAEDDGDGTRVLRPREVRVEEKPSVEAAVEALVSFNADQERVDTLWGDFCAMGTNLDKVKVTGDLITVHFNEPAGGLCDLDPTGWELRRQQLAWTVRDATGSDAPVMVTVGDEHVDAADGKIAADDHYLLPEESPAVSGDTRLVGIGRVAVAIPAAWVSNAASCNAPIRDTYFFPYPQDCVGVARPGVSSVAITSGEFTETGPPLRNLKPAGEIAGHRVREGEGVCQTTPNGPCRQTFGIPDLDAYFTVTIPEDASGHAAAEIAAIRASLTVLPDDQIAIPFVPDGNEGELSTVLQEAGLTVTVDRMGCPDAAADCVSGVVNISPAEGSVVPVGSTVTVTVRH